MPLGFQSSDVAWKEFVRFRINTFARMGSLKPDLGRSGFNFLHLLCCFLQEDSLYENSEYESTGITAVALYDYQVSWSLRFLWRLGLELFQWLI